MAAHSMVSNSHLLTRLQSHLRVIYPDRNHETLAKKAVEAFWPNDPDKILDSARTPSRQLWSERTTYLITYGDTLKKAGEKPLHTLKSFLDTHLHDVIRSVHILPFFPYSSDDGFSVMDYCAVREDLGDWNDIQEIGAEYELMSDLVLNHASAKGAWFKGFVSGEDTYKDFFFTADTDDDLSMVVRPRPSPLLDAVETSDGIKHVWCTFGPDQVDLNFANPDVVFEFIRIMRFYIDNGVRVFRFDAVAFIWKEIGGPCIHLHQTHEIIRMMRTLIDFYEDDVLIITETNVPNHENLTYFGNQNEAHLIYNFSLPPLLIQALLTGNEYHLKKWMMEIPPAQEGCTYFNFVAGHDGIGLRPTTGIWFEEDLDEVVETIKSFGGEVSMRSVGNGEERPYELNISLYDALKGTIEGPDEFQRERFLASQIIMLGMEGVPAFYIHSLLATPNDTAKFERTGHKRHINRHQWNYDDLLQKLNDPKSDQSFIFNEMKRLIGIRQQQACFHPNALQFTIHLPEGFIGFWRQSLDRRQDAFCITNLTNHDLSLPLHALNMYSGAKWHDLITGEICPDRDQELIFNPYQSMWISNQLK